MTFLHAFLPTLLIIATSLPMEEFNNDEKHLENNIPQINYQAFRLNPEFNKDLFQGDIILTPEQQESARQGLLAKQRLWNTSVHYEISQNFSTTEKNTIQQAITQWNKDFAGCLTWKPRTKERNYVKFTTGNGCYSYLGMTGGAQVLCLGKGCFRIGTIIHEMDHAAGMMHEHCRSDRDNYIKMQWQNIAEDWKSQYEIAPTSQVGRQGNYDYKSVMHYPPNAPGSYSKMAYEVKQSGINVREIGQRNGMTEMDKKKVKILYNCRNP